MELKHGANVYTAEDTHVGSIERVVMNPHTQEITHVIVEKGILFTTEKVLPVSLIASASEERVELREDAGKLEKLSDFKEKEFVPLAEEDAAQAYPGSDLATPVYWNPVVGTAWWVGSAYVDQPGTVAKERAKAEKGEAADSVVAKTEEPMLEKTEYNTPDQSVAIKEGASVYSSDGEHVGDVAEVLTDAQSNRATHFVIAQGVIFKEEKLIPTYWLDVVMPEEIRLLVGTRTLQQLPPYEA
jgi:uncharacterized protein YrrD